MHSEWEPEAMLSCRLRWYAHATSSLLRRHWQALLLLAMLLLPAMPVFSQTRILGAPVLAALAPSHGIEWRFAWVHLLEAVGILWVLAQRTAITGGPFGAFLASLPIPDGRRRLVDAIVVIIASTPLLLPVLASAVALAFLPQKAINYLFVLDLFLITLGWQMTALSRNTRNAIALTVANVFLVGGFHADGALRPVLLTVPLLLAAFTIAHIAPASAARSRVAGAFSRRVADSIRTRVRNGLSPVARLQIGILQDRAASTVGHCLMMGSVVASTCFLLALWGFDKRAVPLTLMAQAAISLIAAATYRDLRAAHLHAAHFMRSLPMSAFAKRRADWLTVAALALPFAAVAPLLLAMHGVLSSQMAMALVCSGAPLLALHYLPQRFASRQSVLLGLLLTVVWVMLTWPIFV
ncbi:hypothetical protein BCCH1_67600 [Burkholderia contaminans]|uniref:Uncharacterized protein n=1 Tax=Burkholderia contaminans TaxID=488447 RepID=A0A250LIA9_9BURK|nr:hypothetical protein BCCH1_67600 [Burkholderia contaminans]GLZ70387.1 hypothetical protein Bcon01_34320 [Burkholderia contaminans]